MKSIQLPRPTAAHLQATLFLKPSFSMTVSSSQMSVQVTARPVGQPPRVRS